MPYEKLCRIYTWVFVCILIFGYHPLMAQDAAVNELVITGTVKNKDSRKKLENVNVSVVGNNIGTVTNADGTFSLKVAGTEAFRGLEVSDIGYLTTHLSLEELEKTGELTIWMIPAPNLLSEIVVYGNNPRVIVEEAIKKIPVNYSGNDNMLTAFYRETVQKRRRYISVSEAVMDVYKTDYNFPRCRPRQGAAAERPPPAEPKASDTLAVKVVGGTDLSLYLDIVKNGDALLSTDNLDYYEFRMEDPVNLDNRMQYVVSFRPRVSLMYALFIGKLYIDYERLSFTRAEFGLDMANRVKAVEAILHKKPVGLRFRPQEVAYLVTYKQQGTKTYLNYIRNVIRFKCDWKKRLFSSSYTAFSEMVVTDRTESPLSGISNKNTFKRKQVFYDLVDEYGTKTSGGTTIS